ncbi:NADH-quinone oxidoreductase subunit L [Gillisia sp. Hel_I_86]|uniref:NADH-quinone oxidoreductase subunit L n=1 Tax=Gillisia sp. Hel_I_86 TaxID=1249981 RepID=UPI001199D38C|nr:NADH-quinone oxidoreductase subunit L [Gillisia sp. Hel_I_86]TVZ28639.1 NADH-quinone oxidoreductase subunit L [Gillisia sp. Hel_I_86]
MKELLWLIIASPFAGALLLLLAGGKLSRTLSAIVGVGSVSLSAILTLLVGFEFLEDTTPYLQVAWQWMDVYGLSPNIGFHLDTVSLIFIFIITFVGALIHLYSVEFMWKEKGFVRFFTFMNLFIGFMLILVLADNLLLLYLGWEGVGLCSYLLIGFWYKNPKNGYAARKAFIVTRVGDAAMAIAFYILFMNYNTLNIQDILQAAPGTWGVGSGIAMATAFLLLAGAVGKSAQLPLQTWLPDAMAAPSPVSALIHAATMVTAGVYLIARTHVLFEIAPVVQMTVAIIGAVTLIIAGVSALNQHDIKKVLAYSTISQIGYMFLALGVGAWSAAIFHLMIHAFFKALLFLGAGAVIWVMREEHNMFKMGGLWKKLPITFWTFLVASAALSALPLITAGYYSKDKIIWLAFASDKGSMWLWLAGLVGAFITALYTFRMVFVTFFGKARAEPTHRPGLMMTIPLIILAFLSFAGGFIELPENMGELSLFSDIVDKTLPATTLAVAGHTTELILQLIAAAVAIAAVIVAYKLYFNKPLPAAEPERTALQQFFYKGWDFDLLYDKVIVAPMLYMSRIDKNDFIDLFYTGMATVARKSHFVLSAAQNGQLRWYAMVVAVGAVIILTILFFP